MPSPSDSNPKHGGVALVLLLTLLTIAASFAVYHFYSQSQGEAYANETTDLAVATSLALHKLESQASESDLARIQNKISAYRSRSDADPAVLQNWEKSLDMIEQQLAQDRALVTAMEQRLATLDSTSPSANIEAFDAEIKALDRTLNTDASNRLAREWAAKRRGIMAEIQSVSATIIAKSFPSGAKTYLNGEFIGLSSLGIQNVRKGKHLLAFEKDGYLRAEREIEITESGKVEPPVVELKTASLPLSIQVTGGKKKSKVSISIEKTADNNRDILLFIEEKQGREATFDNAPLGSLIVSVTVDNRLAAEKVIENGAALNGTLEIVLE